MRELGKYFRIYCEKTHRKWPELIQNWLNSSVSDSTGFTPVELFDREPRPYIFKELLKRRPDQLPNEETITEKILKAYTKSKLKSEKRRLKRMTGKNKWTPKVNEMVLVKKHPTSDAIQGITMKFQRPYEEPYVIQTVINPSLVALKDTLRKYKGLFSKKYLKPYHDVEREEKVRIRKKYPLTSLKLQKLNVETEPRIQKTGRAGRFDLLPKGKRK
jgi:hypothetical protein